MTYMYVGAGSGIHLRSSVGAAYRYAFDGSWSRWTVDQSYGYEPGNKPKSDGLGIAYEDTEVRRYVRGRSGVTRPVLYVPRRSYELAARIPAKEGIAARQPALLLNEMVNPDG